MFFSVLDVFTKGIRAIQIGDFPDKLGQYQEKLKRLCLAPRAPLTVRTYGCAFQSEVDSRHSTYRVYNVFSKEAENSVESEILFK